MTITTCEFGTVASIGSKVVAVFSYRYDASLVPDLIANISPSIHAWVACDDRSASQAYSSEPLRRNALLVAARSIGADWILAVDPDERFETDLAERMSAMARPGAPALWTFALRELYTPDSYRTDGLWGSKVQMRLFPANASELVSDNALHGGWVRPGSGLATIASGLNLYHLRHVSPLRRAHRRDTYAATDPERKFQKLGYDYLADDRGAVLEPIPENRRFLPPFVDDGGLWGPPPDKLGSLKPDPVHVRLTYAANVRRRNARLAASLVAKDLTEADPEDVDFSAIAAQFAYEADDHVSVDQIAARWIQSHPEQSLPLYIRAKSRLARGDRAGAMDDAIAASKIAPRLGPVENLRRIAAGGPAAFKGQNAKWRRWVHGPATIAEGTDVQQSDLCVVVIGFKAPAELAAAVESLLGQSIVPEIVVVNTGGGDVVAALNARIEQVRIIAVEEPLFVGAARNIGIDASAAPYVAFLAADCKAEPGWVLARISGHRAGSAAIASPLIPDRLNSLASMVAHAILHRRRSAALASASQVNYGLSYQRRTFLDHGYFSVALRVGEDSEFNDYIADKVAISTAPGLVTTHHYPSGMIPLCRDMFNRGKRRAFAHPFSELRSSPKGWSRFRTLASKRLSSAVESLRQLPQQGTSARFALQALVLAAIAFDTLGAAISFSRVRKAYRLHTKARSVRAHNPGKAMQMLQRATRLDPQWAEGFAALGQAHFAMPGDPHELAGTKAMLRAFDLAPRSPGPLITLCNSLIQRKRWKESLEILEKGLVVAPGVLQYWTKASAIALRLGKKADALFMAQCSLAISPAAPATHKLAITAHLAMGNVAQANKRAGIMADLEPKPAAVQPDRH